MNLLDLWRFIRRCEKTDVANILHCAATAASKSYCGDASTRAARRAARMFGDRPDVEIAIKPSPRLPSPRICRSNTCS